MYNWYAVVDSRNIAPTGWHVPTDAEWATLITFLGGESVAGGKLKETGTAHWVSPNNGATNSTGFTALPGGPRYDYDGSFGYLGANGYWWSSTAFDATLAWYRNIYYYNVNINHNTDGKKSGYSVRCIKD